LRNYYIDASSFWLKIISLFSCAKTKNILLLHPQNLGLDLSIQVLKSKYFNSTIYLLDSSFFCIRSYNHIPSEYSACLRCVDLGFDQVVSQNCKSFPSPNKNAVKFPAQLKDLANSKAIQVIAQNANQARLAKSFFGLEQLPIVAGLWTIDFNEIHIASIEQPSSFKWDFVFHGHNLSAKGANWLVEVARLSPDFQFVFPFSKPIGFDATANCHFIPCSWETGLKKLLIEARYTVVPSLWSAPIEGALIKSLAYSNGVIVVQNPTSYSNELPDDLLLKVSTSPLIAAQQMREALLSNWAPNQVSKSNWLSIFLANEEHFLPNLLAHVLDYSGVQK
jgi:hypothetical protein